MVSLQNFSPVRSGESKRRKWTNDDSLDDETLLALAMSSPTKTGSHEPNSFADSTRLSHESAHQIVRETVAPLQSSIKSSKRCIAKVTFRPVKVLSGMTSKLSGWFFFIYRLIFQCNRLEFSCLFNFVPNLAIIITESFLQVG